MSFQKLFEEFIQMSNVLGNKFHLVQGAGGNTSIKHDGIMHIKASGNVLKDALKNNIFIPIPTGTDPFVKSFAHVGCVRPSIETSMHLILPHNVVAHVHSTHIIALSSLQNAECIFSEILSGLNWAYIPYVKPGLPLALEIEKLYGDFNSSPDILILGNHGLVVGASTPSAILEKIKLVVKKSLLLTRRIKTEKFDKNRMLSATPDGFEPVKYSSAHLMAYDGAAFDYASGGSLYPDHVVFLGRGVLNDCDESKELKTSELLLLRGSGAYLPFGSSEVKHEMAAALGAISLLIPPNKNLNYLSAKEESELVDWDAEAYRRSIN